MINYNVDTDGIATITWDMPGRTMNVLNEGSITAYAGALETALKDEKVKGIIVTSAKADFIAGADLEMLLNADTSDAAKLTEQFSQLQKLFRSQETGGKPIVAAINGTALGGGFEICLASHYRIAAANPRARVGQPEVKLGLLPGAGGTQRIPRLIGVMNAAPILLEGKDLTVETGQGHRPDPRGRAGGRAAVARQGVADGGDQGDRRAGLCRKGRQADRQPRRAAVGSARLQDAGLPRRPGVEPGRRADLHRRQRDDRRQDQRRLSRAQGDHVVRLRGPAAAVRHGAQGRDALFRVAAARPGRQEHDPHAVLRPAGGEQARPPAQGRGEAGVHEDRRARRRPDGRRHRHRLGAGRPRHRADRSRPGRGRQGQGAHRRRARQAGEARPPHAGQGRRAAGQGHGDAGLRRAQGLPAGDRGGVREPRGQGRGDEEGRGRAGADRRCSRRTPRPCRSPAWPRPRRGRTISSACTSSRRSRRCRWSRSSSARRPRPRRSRARWTSCRRSARRRSWSTTAAASSRRASAAPSSPRAIASSRKACRRR